MSGTSHEAWLRDQLQAMGVDALMAEGVADALQELDAGDEEALGGIESFLGFDCDATPRRVLQQYLSRRDGGRTSAAAAPDGMQAYRKGVDESGSEYKASRPAGMKQEIAEARREKVQEKKQAKAKQQLKAGKAILSAGRSWCECQARKHDLVCNCLGCGRIICEQEGEGPCMFCGHLAVPGGAAPVRERPTGEEGGAAGSDGDEAAAEAVAQRDKLVDFDQNSARRTQVYDDQSDYFELDSNMWMDEGEKKVLRERQREEEEAAEARRKRVTVTIDLLGRKVIMPSEGGGDGGSSFFTARDEAIQADAAMAAAATAAVAPEGGGTGTRAAQTVADGVHGPGYAPSRIIVNPTIRGPRPQYVDLGAGGADASKGAGKGGGSGGAAAGGSGGRSGGAGREGKSKSKRIQDDNIFDFDLSRPEESPLFAPAPLDPLEEEHAALSAAWRAGLLEDESGPFDLCLQGKGARKALAAPAGRRKAPPDKGPQVISDGMVVLKGWLSADEQAELVAECRRLGMGEGGFYTPSYGDGAQLHLRMMCLGLHWEPRLAAYEEERSQHDGARPPPIPSRLRELCARCVEDANAAGGGLPGLQPDTCLVNFYERGGRLGMHQDKDESRDAIGRGLPVVSFSLGDACDFHYSASGPDVAAAAKVVLESGDALVFGGAARMLWHGVAQVHPGTAPAELVQRAGLRPGRVNLTFRQARV